MFVSTSGFQIVDEAVFLLRRYKERSFVSKIWYEPDKREYLFLVTEDGCIVSVSPDFLESCEPDKVYMPACISSKSILKAFFCDVDAKISITYDEGKNKIIDAKSVIDKKSSVNDAIGFRQFLMKTILHIVPNGTVDRS